MGPFHVDSEAGQLQRVILHRPDIELKRLTPCLLYTSDAADE